MALTQPPPAATRLSSLPTIAWIFQKIRTFPSGMLLRSQEENKWSQIDFIGTAAYLERRALYCIHINSRDPQLALINQEAIRFAIHHACKDGDAMRISAIVPCGPVW